MLTFNQSCAQAIIFPHLKATIDVELHVMDLY